MICQNCISQAVGRKENHLSNVLAIKGSPLAGNYQTCLFCGNYGSGLNNTGPLNGHVHAQNSVFSKESTQPGGLSLQRIHNCSLETKRAPILSYNGRIENVGSVSCCHCCYCSLGVLGTCVCSCNNTAYLLHSSCCLCNSNVATATSSYGGLSNGFSGIASNFSVNDGNSEYVKQVNEIGQSLNAPAVNSSNIVSVGGGNSGNNGELVCSPNTVVGAHIAPNDVGNQEVNYKTTINPDTINIALTGQTPESLTISIDSRGIVSVGVNNHSTSNNAKANTITVSGNASNANNDDSRARIRNALTDRTQH